MPEDEREEKRSVNPAARHDPPGQAPAEGEKKRREERVRATQGAELDPRDQGGIAE